jgi:hypothetical protein
VSEIRQRDADMAQLTLNTFRNVTNAKDWPQIDAWLVSLLHRANVSTNAELAEMESDIIELKHDLLEVATERDQARERIGELEKDAARYRWLRETADHECEQDSREDYAWFALHNESPDELDRAIDSAIEERAALPTQPPQPNAAGETE